MLKKLFFLLIILSFNTFFSHNNRDSVQKYIHISEKIFSPKDKIKYLEKANSFAKKANDDSLIIHTFSEIALQSILLGDKEKFEASNEILKSIYQRRKFAMPLGLYYQNKGFYYYNNFRLDSAYYYYVKAKIQYKKAKNKAKFIEIY